MERVGVSLKLNRATGKKNIAHAANLVTATPDLKRWYMIRAFEPLGKRSDRMCVSDAGYNLEINDHRKIRKPTVTVFRFDKTEALAECERLSQFVSNCSDYGEFVDRMHKRFGERIALQGVTGDKKELMTIVADPGNERDFRILSTTGTGATAISLRGDKFTFSKWVMGVLNSR